MITTQHQKEAIAKYGLQTEIIPSWTKELSNAGKPVLRIRKILFYVEAKEKFVRRCDRKRIIEKTLLGEWEITTPFHTVKGKRSRSWLGDGIQQDDINCYEEWEVDEIVYDIPALQRFITDKLKEFSL